MFLGGIYLFDAAPNYGTVRRDPAAGRVYEINNHGDKRYVTFAECNRIWGLQIGGVALNAAAFWLRDWHKQRS
jgi:hypothetical protein